MWALLVRRCEAQGSDCKCVTCASAPAGAAAHENSKAVRRDWMGKNASVVSLSFAVSPMDGIDSGARLVGSPACPGKMLRSQAAAAETKIIERE